MSLPHLHGMAELLKDRPRFRAKKQQRKGTRLTAETLDFMARKCNRAKCFLLSEVMEGDMSVTCHDCCVFQPCTVFIVVIYSVFCFFFPLGGNNLLVASETS